MGAVVGEEEGAVASIPGNEGRITQAWENVRGGVRVFAVYFWHSEGWTPRNEALLEAVLKRARVTRHPWLVACDADMSPAEFDKSLWFQKNQMHVVAPERAFHVQVKKVRRENGLRRFTTTSLRVTAYKEKSSQIGGGWKTWSRGRAEQCPFVVERKKGDAGMERAGAAEGAAWLEWRKVARRKHKRKRQRRRGGRRGQ